MTSNTTGASKTQSAKNIFTNDIYSIDKHLF